MPRLEQGGVFIKGREEDHEQQLYNEWIIEVDKSSA